LTQELQNRALKTEAFKEEQFRHQKDKSRAEVGLIK
jgi:hypothetical protein